MSKNLLFLNKESIFLLEKIKIPKLPKDFYPFSKERVKLKNPPLLFPMHLKSLL
jgi:hypothetical protein